MVRAYYQDPNYAKTTRSRWAARDVTGRPRQERQLRDQLNEDKLGPDGTPTVVTREEFYRK